MAITVNMACSCSDLSNRLQNDENFRPEVLNSISEEDRVEDLQLGNPGDISWDPSATGIRILQLRDHLVDLDFYVAKFDGHFVIAETVGDQHYSTCAWRLANEVGQQFLNA